ncbi:hypothetical protein QJ856_gp0653 [Tupanvirus deep ocean]|uniref:Uncharacterized protein n=2 Tax=Tupanvirus TaxID=2094720 RepID=A0AC62A8M4_9VIRU|nr:hypothetical protein QJ856_gp0653 [Tupanvirus deep ocean]QKU34097.1 hypothetical protein [Tupanvirus deep ocean]
MSLYNALFGKNKVAELLLPCVGVDLCSIPRYRDCSASDDNTQIIILTRTGGGNRDSYADENDALASNENYDHDCDADFDSTYAEFYFNIPYKWLADVEKLEEEDFAGTSQEFKELIAKELPQHYKAFFCERVTNDETTI